MALRILLAGCMFVAAVECSAAQTETEKSGTILPGAVDTIPVDISAGQFLRAELEVNGRDLELTVIDAGGATLAAVRNQLREPRPVAISLLATTTSTLRMEIRLPEKGADSAARYRLRLTGPRAAAPDDTERVAADAAYKKGDSVRAAGSRDARLKALEHYQEALRLWRSIGERNGEAAALTVIGQSHFLLGEFKPARDNLEQALALRRSQAVPEREVECLFHLSMTSVNAGAPAKARPWLDEARSLAAKLGDSYRGSLIFAAYGGAERSDGNLVKAMELNRQAVVLAEQAGDRFRRAYNLDNIARTLQSQGEQAEALPILLGNLPYYREIGELRPEMYGANSVGVGYFFLGRSQEALEAYQRALALSRSLADGFMETTILANIGQIYSQMGENERALEHFDRGTALSRKYGQPAQEARMLGEAGQMHARLGAAPRALELESRALELYRKLGNNYGEAQIETFRGDAYRRLRQPRLALECYDRAAGIYRAQEQLLSEAMVLVPKGQALVSVGEHREAEAALTRALSILHGQSFGNLDAEALIALAAVDVARNRPRDAARHIDEALAASEAFRGAIAGAGQRSSFVARAHELYESAIDMLIDLDRRDPAQGYAARAFEVGEAARARSLLDLLEESNADIRQGIDPQLLARERAIRHRLSTRARYRIDVLSGPHTEAEAAKLDRELKDLVRSREEIETQIRAASPAYAVLMQPHTVSLDRLQKEQLDDASVLLEYALGEKRSFLWAVTRTSLNTFVLPGSAELERLARRAYRQLTNRTPLESADALAELGRKLLAPAAGMLKGRRVIVVADGILEYVPFNALVMTGGEPLGARNVVTYLPSASVLAAIRAGQGERRPAPKLAAVIADPVYRPDDPRVRGAAADQTPASPALTRSAADFGVIALDRLYATRAEADEIQRLAAGRGVLEALDFEASRATVTGSALSEYRIVHFAAHGLLNSQHPDLSGLVFSLVTPDGKPANGFVQAHEFYNLKLSAELVVLSACQTALGKEVRGEGLLGLTRAFMYAGAPRVVASLWPVSDVATAELMGRFYRSMLVDHLPAASALRAAQESLRRTQRWSAPYYWAGLTLQGEWR